LKNEIIAFCESGSQVEWLINSPKYSEKNSRFIAVTPDAAWTFQNHDISYLTFDAFQCNKNAGLVEKLQSDQVTWARHVDEILQNNIPSLKETNFCPARNYIFYLKNYWDTFIQIADVLENIKRELSPEKVVFFSSPEPISYDTDLMIQSSALSHCIPEWAPYHQIEQIKIPALASDKFWITQVYMKRNWAHAFVASFKSLLKKTDRHIRKHLKSEKNRAGSHAPDRINHPRPKLVLRDHYDITDEVVHYLEMSGVEIILFNDFINSGKNVSRPDQLLDAQKMTSLWSEISKEDWFWQPGGWQDWQLKGVLVSLFQHFWFKTIPVLWKSMLEGNALIAQVNPCGIVYGGIWGPRETGFVMAARASKVPVIFYQHGSSMGDIQNTIWDLIDLYYSDYQLVYGEGERDYIEKRLLHMDSLSTGIPVGSARLDYLSKNHDDPRTFDFLKKMTGKKHWPFVVYIPGAISNNLYRYDFNYFRNCYIFEIRTKIAKTFKKYPGYRFGYKAFLSRGNDPTIDMLSAVCPECEIIDSIPLSELQWSADMLVYEMPSTGLYEGMLTDKPIIALTDRDLITMPDSVKDLLKKRVTLCDSGSEFVQTVDCILERGALHPITDPDRSFLKKFCTYLDDGNSAIRAADTIHRIIRD
jgi:hypothetical protein